MQDDFDEKRGYNKAMQDPWGRRRRRWRIFRKIRRFVARVPNVFKKAHKFVRTSLKTLNELKAAVRRCCNHRLFTNSRVCKLAG